MNNLIRFHDWIIPRDEISSVRIEYPDGEPNSEFEKTSCVMVLELKGNKKFSLKCGDLYDARKELNILTSRVQPELIERPLDSYIIQQIYFCRDSIRSLESAVKDLMKKYKEVKSQ